MQLLNPATGAVEGIVDVATEPEVIRAVAEARTEQTSWAATTMAERVATIRRFRTLVAARTSQLADVLTAETGKPIAQSRAELEGLLPRLDFFADHVETALADESVFSGDELAEVIVREPLGVVADISAWNYPWFVSCNVVVPALLAGNAVVFKPSEFAVLSGLALGSLLHEAGVPHPVLPVLVGGGDVGAILVDQPVDGVFFTGSYATGRRISERLAGRPVTLQLELGGSDPAYVTDDVDVAEVAVALADGVFYNNGQSCCSVERIFVHAAVHDAFVDRFVGEVAGFVMGDPTDADTYLGPLTRAAQVEILDAQIADAADKGGRIRLGGASVDRGPGAWYQPTVITNATDDMALMRDESFGPVVGIGVVTGDDQAVERMNATEFALTAGVWCRDERRARRLLARVDAGSAYWNCCDRVSPRLPWSGRRRSGTGVTLSEAGLVTFTRPKALHLRRP